MPSAKNQHYVNHHHHHYHHRFSAKVGREGGRRLFKKKKIRTSTLRRGAQAQRHQLQLVDLVGEAEHEALVDGDALRPAGRVVEVLHQHVGELVPQLALPEVLKGHKVLLQLFGRRIALLGEEVGDLVDVHGGRNRRQSRKRSRESVGMRFEDLREGKAWSSLPLNQKYVANSILNGTVFIQKSALSLGYSAIRYVSHFCYSKVLVPAR